jgi:hypothetical protein
MAGLGNGTTSKKTWPTEGGQEVERKEEEFHYDRRQGI